MVAVLVEKVAAGNQTAEEASNWVVVVWVRQKVAHQVIHLGNLVVEALVVVLPAMVAEESYEEVAEYQPEEVMAVDSLASEAAVEEVSKEMPTTVVAALAEAVASCRLVSVVAVEQSLVVASFGQASPASLKEQEHQRTIDVDDRHARVDFGRQVDVRPPNRDVHLLSLF